jgi:hypothetical protein
MLEIKSVMIHFQGKAFNYGHLLAYQFVEVRGDLTVRGKS